MKKLIGFIKRIKTDKWETASLLLIIGLAAFFRFWQLGLTQYFTYDQARDYLIVKRIIINHKFTLIGPTVLIPGVYLPPFYYYSLVPALFFSNFHLIGPDVYTAFLGTLTVLIFYLLAKDIFGQLTAVLTSLIFASLPLVVVASRHAWNPNATQLFSLLVFAFLWQFVKDKNWTWFYFALVALGWGLNLHFSMIMLLPLTLGVFFLGVRKKRSRLSEALIGCLILAIFLFPLLLFEFRHGFLITHNLASFLGEKAGFQAFGSRLLGAIIDSFKMPFILFVGHLIPGVKSVRPSHIILLNQLPLFRQPLSWLNSSYFWFSFLLVALILIFGIVSLFSQKKGIVLIWSWFLLGLAVRLFVPPASFYFYQYTFLFPAVLFLLANFFHLLIKFKKGKMLTGAIVLVFLGFGFWELFNLSPGLKREDFYQEAARKVASDFYQSKPVEYVVAANNLDSHRWDRNGLEYRYFLEALYHLPLSGWEAVDYQQAQVLYLIDESNLSNPFKLGGMEIEAFGPARVDQTWQLADGKKVYKLVKAEKDL